MPGPQSGHVFPAMVLILCLCRALPPLLAQLTPDKTDSIQGTVINGVTHDPIGRALVFSPDNQFATLTDARGHFEFKFPAGPGRPAELMARKPGFLSKDNQPIQIAPNQKELTISLLPEALIIGHVVTASSDGSAKVAVNLLRRQIQEGRARWSQANSVIVRSDGEFRFADLAPGSYKLFTGEEFDRDPLAFDPKGQIYGYPPVYFPVANNFASAGTIQLSAGQTMQVNLEPTRRPYYPVEVSVVNAPAGLPVEVTVSPAGQRGPGYSLGYDAAQEKIEGLLPDGIYTIEISTLNSGAAGTANISVKGGPLKGAAVALVPNGPLPLKLNEEFTATENAPGTPPTAGLGGSFVGPGPVNKDGRGHPRYLQAWLEPADDFGPGRGGSLREPRGPDDEALVFDNAQPGHYWLRVNSSRGYVATAECGGTDLLHHPLVVAPGGGTPPIEITIRDDGAQVDGVIEEAVAVPAAKAARQIVGAGIYLIPMPDSTGQFRQVWVSPEGNFSSQQIPPGEYLILAFDTAQAELEYTNPEVVHKYEPQGQVIRLLSGQKQHLRLHLVPRGDQP